MRRTLSNVGSTATHSTEPVCPTYLLIASFVLLVVSTYVRTRIQKGETRACACACAHLLEYLPVEQGEVL